MFTAPVTVQAITIRGWEALTGLKFVELMPGDPVTTEKGVYSWSASRDAGTYYHGKGDGRRGLAGRLGTERSLISRISSLLAIDADPVSNIQLSSYVPAARAMAQHGLVCFVAVARPANWAGGPATAREWERFMSEAMAILAGHRGVMGGGAWDLSTLGWAAWEQARARITALSELELV